jgi:hypothetical protein
MINLKDLVFERAIWLDEFFWQKMQGSARDAKTSATLVSLKIKAQN